MKPYLAALSAFALAATGTVCAPSAWAQAPRPMTGHDFVTLKRVAAPAVSPDGRIVVWQQTDTDPGSYQRTTGLWRMPISGGNAERIADLPEASESAPAFSPDGKRLYFISSKSGSDQVWTLDLSAAGAAPVQASFFKADVAGFSVSPNGQRILVWGDVARNCPTLGCDSTGNASLPGPGSGRHYKDGTGFIRHWDAWETPGNYSRGFAFSLNADGIIAGDGVPLDGPADSPEALIGDTPSKPFGGAEELSWAADSQSVFFVARISDRFEPISTDLDIWQSRLDGMAPRSLTAANNATDTMPAASPDGKWLAWAAMARPGYESDRLVVYLRDLSTGAVRALTSNWDRSVGSLTWSRDSRHLIATANDMLDNPAYRIDPVSGDVDRIDLAPRGRTEGHVGSIVPLADGGLLYTRDSIATPAEIWTAPAGKTGRQITRVNLATLAGLTQVTTERFSFTGARGDTVWGQVHKPAGSKASLPVLLFVHGGPQGSYSDSWSWRWNPKFFASQGYAVVSIDFHGSTGYGQAFTDSINRDWGGKPLEDLKLGLSAALSADTQLDGTRACALGPSYGGFMMNWIQGKWSDRFKCLVQHDGVFDARAMAYETDELWFDEWEHGGHPYHEAVAEFEKWNPVHFVNKWQTPMLVITSEKDFRIPYTQGLAAYAALQRRGVPGELLVFPDENHWVLKPKNSLQWHQTVFDWLDRWLKH